MRAMYVPFVCSLLLPAVTATAQEFRASVFRHSRNYWNGCLQLFTRRRTQQILTVHISKQPSKSC